MLQRSCWKIPKSAMTDADGAPAFADLVVYDESPQFVYALAAQWDRPDIAAAGGTREDLSKATAHARYLRTTVRRPAANVDDPDEVLRVKASAVETSDEVLEADVPAVLFAGDVAADVVGATALAEAARRIVAEKQPAVEEAPAPEVP